MGAQWISIYTARAPEKNQQHPAVYMDILGSRMGTPVERTPVQYTWCPDTASTAHSSTEVTAIANSPTRKISSTGYTARGAQAKDTREGQA